MLDVENMPIRMTQQTIDDFRKLADEFYVKLERHQASIEFESPAYWWSQDAKAAVAEVLGVLGPSYINRKVC